jgi:acyl carrier protein
MLSNVLKSSKQARALVNCSKRFEGAKVWYQNYASNDMLPKSNLRQAGDCMDETEVITRMNFVLHNFQLWDLKNIDWNKPWDEQGMDSLDSTAFLTSFEHEFHTIFEDNVFDSFETFN